MTRAMNWCVPAAVALLMASCAPPAPSQAVQVQPGKNKSAVDFANDQAACRTLVQQQGASAQQQAALTAAADPNVTNGLASGSVATIASTLLGAAATGSAGQAAMQQQYDATYLDCMVRRGNLAPGSAPTAVADTGPDPSLVRSVQAELIRVGALKGTADGALGPKTRSAISSYEQSNGLRVDGDPSPALLADLRQHATPSTASTWVAPVAAAPVAAAPMAAAPGAAPAATAWTKPVAVPTSAAMPAATANPGTANP
jgi:hypothetical protein